MGAGGPENLGSSPPKKASQKHLGSGVRIRAKSLGHLPFRKLAWEGVTWATVPWQCHCFYVGSHGITCEAVLVPRHCSAPSSISPPQAFSGRVVPLRVPGIQHAAAELLQHYCGHRDQQTALCVSVPPFPVQIKRRTAWTTSNHRLPSHRLCKCRLKKRTPFSENMIWGNAS